MASIHALDMASPGEVGVSALARVRALGAPGVDAGLAPDALRFEMPLATYGHGEAILSRVGSD
jgi:hypothetical protein